MSLWSTSVRRYLNPLQWMRSERESIWSEKENGMEGHDKHRLKRGKRFE
jgi:hypothetical protein